MAKKSFVGGKKATKEKEGKKVNKKPDAAKKADKKTEIKTGSANKLKQRLHDFSEKVSEIIKSIDDKLPKVSEEKKKKRQKSFRKIMAPIEKFCGNMITHYDNMADIISWKTKRMAVVTGRNIHDFRMTIIRERKEIFKGFLYFVICFAGVVLLIGYSIDYEYSYNGRALGVVKEQRDVLEVLDLISDELSQEYGSSVTIDPEQDIEFKPLIATKRPKDDADTVLTRFTYMGDIQATAYGIEVDGETLVILESEAVCKEIMDSILSEYIKDAGSTKKYESIGFTDDIKVVPVNTTIANIQSKSTAVKKLKNGGEKEETYKVVSGDTLYGICDKLGITLNQLKKMNPGLNVNSTLRIGQKLILKQEVPLLSVQTVEVSTFAESIDYDTIYKESSSYYKGEKVVTRAGKKGKQRVTARLTKVNGKTIKREDLEVEVITEPVSKVVVKGTKKVPAKKGTGTFQRPVNVAVYRGYGMRWGRMHYGLDYAAPTGTPIHAADGGTVTAAGWSGAYGYRITIDHGGGFTTLYGHCSRISVSVGEKVYKGQTIGYVGNTGRSTGPHCHFEIKKYGTNVNPANYV